MKFDFFLKWFAIEPECCLPKCPFNLVAISVQNPYNCVGDMGAIDNFAAAAGNGSCGS